MEPEIESVEARLKSFIHQFKVEYGILERLLYKNKNQHRRSSYFQYLLKVRRDLRLLLQSARVEDILNSTFLVIHGNRTNQKVQLLESLKRRNCEGRHNFLERLLGAARLLSQITEPMVKAAMEISTLLARSFFIGFSLTVLALLARLRVLVQQILLDVVSVYNVVSSLSRKEQSVKLTHDGLMVYRDLYPASEQAVYLECVWKDDKFVLSESNIEPVNKNHDAVLMDVSPEASTVQYQRIETLLGDEEDEPKKIDQPSQIKGENLSLLESSTNRIDDAKLVRVATEMQNRAETCGRKRQSEGVMLDHSSVSSISVKKLKSESRNKVAFVSVKLPVPSTRNDDVVPVKDIESFSHNIENPVICITADRILKEGLL